MKNRMKQTLAVLVLLFAAAAANADELKTTAPDYSKPALMRITRDINVEKSDEFSAETPGVIEVNRGSTRLRLAYLPILAPLQGSYPRVTMEWPNPFALTGTSLPMTLAQWNR